jgi:hypothetical protein
MARRRITQVRLAAILLGTTAFSYGPDAPSFDFTHKAGEPCSTKERRSGGQDHGASGRGYSPRGGCCSTSGISPSMSRPHVQTRRADEMTRVIAYADGFNLYFGLRSKRLAQVLLD